MKKNGFVLVESVVVLVIVVLALTLFLSSYFLLTRKSESKDYYDLPNDKYLLYNVSNIWSLGNNGENAYTQSGSFVIDKNTCGNYISKYSDNECQKVFSDTDLERYAVIYNLNSSFDTGRIKDISGMTSDIIEYLKTLKKLDGATDLSYVVGVFKRNVDGKDKKYYAALTFNPYPTYNTGDDDDPIPLDGEYILAGVGLDKMSGQTLTAVNGATYVGNSLTVSASTAGLRLPRVFQNKNKYLVTYKIRKTSGSLYSIGGNTKNITDKIDFYIDGVKASTKYNPGSSSVLNVTDDMNQHTIKVVFISSNTGTIDLYIQPNYRRSDSVTVDISDVHIYQVYSGPNTLALNSVYSANELPIVSNSLSNVNNMKDYLHLGWYKESSFTNKVSIGNNFTSSTATFISDKDALVFAKIMKESDVQAYCTLKATSSGISFDKLKGASYQISTSSATPSTYDNKTSLTPLATGTYYGHVAAGTEKYTCSIQIVEQVPVNYTCSSTGTAAGYGGSCACYERNCTGDECDNVQIALGDCLAATCSATCNALSLGPSAYGRCYIKYRCPDGTIQETQTCKKTITSLPCPSGYSNSQTNTECPNGSKIINSTTLCAQ